MVIATLMQRKKERKKERKKDVAFAFLFFCYFNKITLIL